ncbi:MAG: hypothetical protein KQH83_09625, partial [Actinobacteria bacterium]|nr:hypothetical protein [Actinomycetota bacterium]
PEHTYCEECGIALGAPALVAAAPGLDTQPAADPARATWWQWAAVVVIVGGIGAAIAASVLWDRDGDPPSTEAAPAPTAQEASTTLPPTTPPPAAGQDPAATVPTGTLLDLDRLPSPEDARTCEDLADAAVVFLDLTVDVYDRIQAGDRSRALALDYAELARLGDEYAAHAAGFDCTDEEMEGLLRDRIGPPDGGDIRSMLMWAAIPGDAAFTDVGDEEGSHG